MDIVQTRNHNEISISRHRSPKVQDSTKVVVTNLSSVAVEANIMKTLLLLMVLLLTVFVRALFSPLSIKDIDKKRKVTPCNREDPKKDPAAPITRQDGM